MSQHSGFDPTSVVAKNISFYQSIKPKTQDNNYTVLATLNDASSLDLLALATGTQANLKQYDNDIEDCHAESLLKRAYKRYVIDKVLFAINNSATSTREDVEIKLSQVSKEISQQELILFISQFPCGLIKRFEGPDLIDEVTGDTIVRKPGRGQVLGGKVVYVTRDNCFGKLRRWISSYGFLGRSLASKLGVSSKLTHVLIGNCEPDAALDYGPYLSQLNQHLSINDRQVQCNLINMRREEFTYQSDEKLPLPVATVWWASSNHDSTRQAAPEYVANGRRLGITKKQCVLNLNRLKLRSSDFCLHEDLDQIPTTT